MSGIGQEPGENGSRRAGSGWQDCPVVYRLLLSFSAAKRRSVTTSRAVGDSQRKGSTRCQTVDLDQPRSHAK